MPLGEPPSIAAPPGEPGEPGAFSGAAAGGDATGGLAGGSGEGAQGGSGGTNGGSGGGGRGGTAGMSGASGSGWTLLGGCPDGNVCPSNLPDGPCSVAACCTCQGPGAELRNCLCENDGGDWSCGSTCACI